LLSVLRSERARPEWLRSQPYAWKLAIATVCFGAFMGQLDASIVTLTYRPVEQQFHASLAGVQWISLAYLLTLTAMLAPLGRRSDQKGRKLSYLQGFLVFVVGSGACAVAPDLGVLIGARVLQAAGAALLQSNSVALVATSAPQDRLRAALGIQAAAQAVGLALGPTVGGVLVSTIGWRWVYTINVPVGLVAVFAGVFFLPRTRDRSPATPLDAPGVALLAAGSASLLLGLSAISGLVLPAAATAVIFAGAAAMLGGFARRQASTPNPLLARSLLSAPGVAGDLIAALCSYLVLFGPLVLVPTLLTSRGVSALHAGLVLSSLPAGFALAATILGGLLPRGWSDHSRARVGAAGVCAVLAASLGFAVTQASLIPILALLGVSLGILTPANNATIMRSVPAADTASAGGVLNMTRGLGTAIGIAAVTLSLHDGSAHTVLAVLLGAAGVCLIALRPERA
jgi:MFS family permease